MGESQQGYGLKKHERRKKNQGGGSGVEYGADARSTGSGSWVESRGGCIVRYNVKWRSRATAFVGREQTFEIVIALLFCSVAGLTMMSRRKIIAIYLGLLLYTTGPLLCVGIASGIAEAMGSTLNESGAGPCVVLGHDIGPLLSSMFVFGWFGLITLPSGAMSLIGFTIAILVSRARARRKLPTHQGAN